MIKKEQLKTTYSQNVNDIPIIILVNQESNTVIY